jgi:hypothetical protein
MTAACRISPSRAGRRVARDAFSLAPDRIAQGNALRGAADATSQWLDGAWTERAPGTGELPYGPSPCP